MTAPVIDLAAERQRRSYELRVLMVEFDIFDGMTDKLAIEMDALRLDLLLDGPRGDAARDRAPDLAIQAEIVARLRSQVAAKLAKIIGHQAPAA